MYDTAEGEGEGEEEGEGEGAASDAAAAAEDAAAVAAPAPQAPDQIIMMRALFAAQAFPCSVWESFCSITRAVQ